MAVATSWIPFGDDASLEQGLLDVLDNVTSGGGWVWVAALAAAGIGALHALGPGHGKVLIGAYLLSGRGQRRDALALGVLVAAMHTVSVLVVGAALAATQRGAASPAVETSLRTLTGIGVVALGLSLLWRARSRRVDVPAGAGADHHHHHPMPAAEVAPLSRAGLAAIATTGGLLPSPAAVLVLVTTLALERPVLGIVLVGAFGVGLAATLAGIGLAVLEGRVALEGATTDRPWLASIRRALPPLSAVAVTLGGLVLLVTALTG